jgi:hypothetical protein
MALPGSSIIASLKPAVGRHDRQNCKLLTNFNPSLVVNKTLHCHFELCVQFDIAL